MSNYLKDNISHDEIKSLRYTLKELDVYLKELDRDRGNGYKNDVNERRLINKIGLVEDFFNKIR